MAEDRFSKEAHQLAQLAAQFAIEKGCSFTMAIGEAVRLLGEAEKALAEGEFDAHS